MNWLRQNYKQLGSDGVALFLMIVLLGALWFVGVAFSLRP